MTGTTTEAAAPTAAATHEAAMLTDLAYQAMQRADELICGHIQPDKGTLALAIVCSTAIEDDENLGVERGSDWTEHLLDMMAFLGRSPPR